MMLDRRVQRFVSWVLVVVVALLIVVAYQVHSRNESIAQIQAAAVRIETAATHTEEVLVEVVQSREAPEAVAQSQRVREALNEISQIKAILCDTVDHDLCEDG